MAIAALVKSLSHASGTLSNSDTTMCARVAEVSKAVCEASFRRLVSQADGMPILRQSSCDGTPVKVKKVVSLVLPAKGKTTLRSGSEAHEFLITISFLRFIDSFGRWSTRAWLHDPRPLTQGKSVPALVSASARIWRSCRQLGHTGPCVEAYVFDRCGFASLKRHFEEWHEQRSDQFGVPDTKFSPELLWITELVVFAPCALHDAQNAFKWAMAGGVVDADLLRNVHIAVESLRNSTDLLVRHVALWVNRHIRFVSPWATSQMQEWYELWTALGVEPDLCEILSCTLQFRWEDDAIFIVKDQEGSDCVGLIMNVLLDLWRFREFTDSRWLQTGTCGRSFIVALLTGIGSCVQEIRGDPTASEYFIGGFDRLGANEKAFLAQAAIVSRVSDAAHVLLMEDGRVLEQLDELKESMNEEMQWMIGLPAFFWSKVASVCDLRAHELKQRSIDAGFVCIGFFDYRVFAAAQEYPWRLAMGNVSDNLSKLAAEDEPLEPTAHKVWLQLRAGLPRKMIERQVCLLRDVCWSTLVAEQLHGTAAAIRRHHPEYTMDTLMARAMVMATNQLMPKPSDHDRKIEKLKQRLETLKHKCPNKAGGRQMYLKELHEAARGQMESSGQPTPRGFAKFLMKNHANVYSKKVFQVRHFYESRAKTVARQKQVTIDEEIELLKAELGLATAHASEAAAQRPPMVLRDCHWGDADFKTFSAMMDDPSCSAASVAASRANIAIAPPPVKEIANVAVAAGVVPAVSGIGWLSQVCSRRGSFVKTAFIWGRGAERQAVKFLFASRSPAYVGVSPMAEVSSDAIADAAQASSNDLAGQAAGSWRTSFVVDFLAHRSLVKIVPDNEADVLVLPHLVHVHTNVWASDALAVPLRSYIDRFPVETMRDGPPSAKKPRTKVNDSLDEVLKAHPWLNSSIAKVNKAAGVMKSSVPAEPATSSDSSGEEEDDDSSLEKLFAKLEAARPEVELRKTMHDGDFVVVVLAGVATLVRDGPSYQGVARGGLAEDWCRRRGLRLSASFLMDLYTPAGAASLARAWCHRMQFFFNLYVSGGLDVRHAFTAEQMEAYEEPTELAALMADPVLQGEGLTRRIAQIRKLFS